MDNWQDKVRLIGIRLIAPHRPKELAAALQGAKRILVVEQSQSGQFYDYLRAKYDLPAETRSLSEPGPLPIAPATLYNRITEWN